MDLVDATKPTRVVIIESDREALQCSPQHCPIANALMRRPGVQDAYVGATIVRVMTGGVWVRYELSAMAKAQVLAFDRDNQIMPAGCRIDLIPPHVKLGTRAKKRPPGQRTGTKPREVSKLRPSYRNIFVEPPADR